MPIKTTTNNSSNNNNSQLTTTYNNSQPQQNCAHCDFLDTYYSSGYLHYSLWFSSFSPRNFTLLPPEALPFKTDTDEPKNIQVLPGSQNWSIYFNIVSECWFAHPRMDRGTGNFYVNAVGNKRVAQVNLELDENLKAWEKWAEQVF